ncbi:MAG: PAS domain S-box protein [Clostridia bacterium]|nr:PAS domain S-box protein [Clostridia bacterium]
MFLDLFANITIVASFLFLVGQLFKYYPLGNSLPLRIRLILGVIFGVLGIALMEYSISATGTILVDLRNVAIISAGIIGGPVSTTIAAIIIAAFRILRYGISIAAITGAFVALIMGAGCAYLASTKFSRLQKYIAMFSFAMLVSMAAFRFLISDTPKLLSIFSYYIPISLFGVLLSYFACEYIVSANLTFRAMQYYRIMADNLSDMVSTHKADGTFIYISPSSIQLLGYLPNELASCSPFDLIHPDDMDRISKSRREFLKTLEPYTQGYRMKRKDGRYIWVESSVKTIKNKDGSLEEIICVTRDITQRKVMEETLRESEERFRTAFEDAAVGMAIVSVDGKFLRVNGPYCQMVGYDEIELISTTFWNLTHPEDIKGNCNAVKRLVAGEVPSFQIEKRYIHKQGHVIWVQINTALMRDKSGKPMYFIAQGQDITSRKYAEDELKRMYEELKIQRAQAIEATKHKSRFLANMSHELRTPLNSIIGFTNRVLKKSNGVLPQVQYENLIIVKQEAQHLLELINNLLDYSKVEAGKMEIYPERFNLVSVINEIHSISAALIEEKPLTYRQNVIDSADMPIYGDKIKIKQILINLLSNASKYSDKGTITLTVNRKDDYYRIEVQDEGIGIADGDIKDIFDEFRQIDGSHTRKVGGTGLGLSITKKFVEMSGGRIEVVSTLGEGSCFTVYLPVSYKEETMLGEKQ